MKKAKALLIYSGFSSFVKADYEILSQDFDVNSYQFSPYKNFMGFAWSNIALFFFCLFNIRKYSVVYCWFADYHSAFPVLFSNFFSKTSVVVVGGYDAMYIPEIEHGVFKNLKSYRVKCVKYALSNATYVFPVDESLEYSVNTYADSKGIKVGIKHYVKHFKGQIVAIPTGYNPNAWMKPTEMAKKQSVITLASVPDNKTFKLKGLDMFLEIATQMPEVQFSIVGLSTLMEQKIRPTAPENVRFFGYVEHSKLPAILSEHKVYAQLSLCEGLPNALCEAMLCECIPVGSNVNGIPKGIGNTGFILKNRDVNEAIKLVSQALVAPSEMGVKARQRIKDIFSEQYRKERILSIINE
ncbi:MAG: glycosyltransferase family 4 protein [Bacteroidales bacterium]